MEYLPTSLGPRDDLAAGEGHRNLNHAATLPTLSVYLNELKVVRQRGRETHGLEGACSICHTDFSNDYYNQKVVQTACDHRFHHGCLTNWNKGTHASRNTCPLCRTHLFRTASVVPIQPDPYEEVNAIRASNREIEEDAAELLRMTAQPITDRNEFTPLEAEDVLEEEIEWNQTTMRTPHVPRQSDSPSTIQGGDSDDDIDDGAPSGSPENPVILDEPDRDNDIEEADLQFDEFLAARREQGSPGARLAQRFLRRIRNARASESNRYYRADRRRNGWEPSLTHRANIRGLRANDNNRGFLPRSPRTRRTASSLLDEFETPSPPYPPVRRPLFPYTPADRSAVNSTVSRLRRAATGASHPPAILEPRAFANAPGYHGPSGPPPYYITPDQDSHLSSSSRQPTEVDIEARIEAVRRNIRRDYIYVAEFASMEDVTAVEEIADHWYKYRVCQYSCGATWQSFVFADAFVMSGKRAIFFKHR
ncbi:hypothetical protein PMIN03_003974 [Paraphaeosphaeria minitans]|uniref:RING-type domain-containing protein n=1 Tax=Paraphaeosphaeria minitans TaxID=565426 RepID=A0A9P6GHF2_9PLEO|nr:hypothetical protein PMIN01_06465 [Paraphaeosphaeria minitans]